MISFNNSFDKHNYISNDNIYYSPNISHDKSGNNIYQNFTNNFMIGNTNLTNNEDSYLNKTISKKNTLLRSQSSIINGIKNEYSIPSKLFKGNFLFINKNKKKTMIPFRNKYINFIKNYEENVPNKESNYNRYSKSQLILGDSLNNYCKKLKSKNNELFPFAERKNIKNKSKKKSKINIFRNIEKKYSQIFRNNLSYKNRKNENFIKLRKNESPRSFWILKQKSKSKFLNYTISKAENFQILSKNSIDYFNNNYNNYDTNHYSYLSKENIDNNNININKLQKQKYNNLLSSFDYNNRKKPKNISDNSYNKTPNIQNIFGNKYYNNKIIISNNGNNDLYLSEIKNNNIFNNNYNKYKLYFDYT